MLYRPRKAVTIGHAFRLGEALGALVVLVGRKVTRADEEPLANVFTHWRRTRSRSFATTEAAIRWMRARGLRIVVAEVTKNAVPYHHLTLGPRERVALVVGSEDAGVGKGLLRAAASHVYVPMVGRSSCLSVGMTLAVVAYHNAFVACDTEAEGGRSVGAAA